MADKPVENTPAPEVKKPEETTPPSDKKEEKTAGEIIDAESGKDKKPVKAEPETVGLDKYLDVKAKNKELTQALKDLEAKQRDGAPLGELTDDIDALGKEFEVDPKFLNKLTAIIESRAGKKADAVATAKLKSLEDKDRSERIDKAFTKHFGQAIDNMPEYKDIVNPEVIKTLSLDPRNAQKTFSQLIEETYGNAITGKRTIESTKPGGGKGPTEVDFDKAKKDPNYFKEIMGNPELKKKYNEGLIGRIGNHL